MNYDDIKGKVIHITQSLKLIPVSLLEGVLGKYGSLDDSNNDGILRRMRHPSIEVVVHGMKLSLPNTYHKVCSVLVDGTPAFLFLEGGYYGEDYTDYQILDAPAYKQYIRYLVEMIMNKALEDVSSQMVEITYNGLYPIPTGQLGTPYIKNYYDDEWQVDTTNRWIRYLIEDP